MKATRRLRWVLLGTVLVLGACDGENCFVTGAECAPVGGVNRRELSADEAHFMQLAFHAESPDGRIARWARPIRIGFTEPATALDVDALEYLVGQLAALLGDVNLSIVSADPTLRVSYVPRDSVRKLGGEDAVGLAWLWAMDWEIQGAGVYVAEEYSGTARVNILGHEIVHALGLVGHSDDPRSILYTTLNYVTVLPDHDRFAIRTLYSPALTPGLTREGARQALGW
jgi:hypothetical protein